MNSSFIIAQREFKERLNSRYFLAMALLGPILVIFGLYALFSLSGNEKEPLHILVVDPANITNKIITGKSGQITYQFVSEYIEVDDFHSRTDFQQFDALLEINEKVITNNLVFLFQRKVISPILINKIHRDIEKRLEIQKAQAYTDLDYETFRNVMHSVRLEVRDAQRPAMKNNYFMAGYTGFFFGFLILLFVMVFGMNVMRSSSREKTNRVAEVMLSMVQPRELLLGKIFGIGLSAILQVTFWFIGISIGLYLLRITTFPDLFSGDNLLENEGVFVNNSWVSLVYNQINFGIMLPWFVLIFMLSYLFYGSLFAALGAAQGSESDGQKFLIPLFFLFVFALFSGYYCINYPESNLSIFFRYFPFTAPMALMVNIALGVQDRDYWHFLFSLLTLVISSWFLLRIAGRVYRAALLRNGYRLNWKKFFKWASNKN